MPIGYNTKCRSCGEEDGVIESYWSLRHEGKDIPLPHPEETTYIQKYGYTKLQATLEGRLLDNNAYTCESCKELFYKPTLILANEFQPPSRRAKFIIWMLMLPVIGIAVFTNLKWSIAVTVLVLIVVVFAIVLWIGERRLRKRLLVEHSPPESHNCPNCSSDQITPLPGLNLGTGDRMPGKCHKCGAYDLFITRGWLS